MFTEVPQTAGCCDQGIPTKEHRIADYVIYSGFNAGERDAAISTMWLQAYGAHAVGVTGPHSEDPYKPFVNPRKFEGVLRELWRDGDDVIFEVPQRSTSLAHVIDRSEVVSRPPRDGLDVGPLMPYLRGIETATHPDATFSWINGHVAHIRAALAPDQLLSVQISYDNSWRARVNGHDMRVSADPLGLMVIEPRCLGDCLIELAEEPTVELRWMFVAQALGAVGFVLFWFFPRKTGTHTPL
jgi:hypothetical protein